MTIASFFAAIAHSFYSSAFYREVAESWKGLGMRYLLFVLLLAWLPFTATLLTRVAQIDPSHYNADTQAYTQTASLSLNNILHSIINQLPSFEVAQGEVHFEGPQPYNIIDPATSKLLMVIDTTGTINSLQGTDAYILITDREIYVRSGTIGEVRYTVEELVGQETIQVTPQAVAEGIENAKNIALWTLPLVFLPVSVAIAFVYSMVGALCYAVLGLAISRILNVMLDFKSIFRLALVARTPVIFLEMLRLLSPPVILKPYQNIIFFGVSIAYLFFAISANQRSDEASDTNR